MIFYEAVLTWLETYKKNSVKHATYDRLITSYNMMLNYNISQIRLHDMVADDIQEYINTLVNDNYALSTIRKQYHLVGAYLDYAFANGLIKTPIYKAVKLPSQSAVKKQKKDVVVYSDAEQTSLKHVLNTLDREGYGAAMIMMEAGLRVGEVLSLTWDDILWNKRAVRVNKTLVHLANKKRMYVQDGAKSFTSNRVVPLNKTALDILTRIRDSFGGDSQYIFHDECGQPISYEALRYQLQHACDEAKVPYKGMHVFRHTFATNCYYRGCDVKILSKLLGHADVTITYNTYIHLFGDALEEMRSVIG